MCKHVLNAQVSIRAPCCGKWFDCAQCHQEQMKHPLKKQTTMIFGCKKCKGVFRKNMLDFDEADEYCPYCDNHFYVEAETKESKQIKDGKGMLVVNFDKEQEVTEELKAEVMKKLLEEDDGLDL
ncbi:hypothetical protein WA158_001786 [Blastocystis sp. Blastoise]